MKRKILIVVSLVILSAGAASWWYVKARAAVVGEFPADVVAMLPSDASVIVYADMSALRDEPLVQRLAALAPAAPGTEYADFIAATGFDYQRDLDRFVLASTGAPPTPQTPPGHALMIADGRFDHNKIEAYVLRVGQKQQQDGHTVYTAPGMTPGKTTAFTFLSASRIAIADSGDISAVWTAHSPADPGLQAQITRVAGAPLFMVAKPQAIIPSAGRATGLSTPLKGLRWVNLAARPDNDRVLLSAEGSCDTPEQAKQLAATIELLRGMTRGMMSDPKNLGNMPPATAQAMTQMLQTAQISSEAERVRLLVTMDTAILAAVPAPPKGR